MIDRAICLCLDKRCGEWASLLEQCEKVNIEFIPFVAGQEHYPWLAYDRRDVDEDTSGWGYGHPDKKINHLNAFRCHQEMIKLAKDCGFKNILLLEDDAVILKRFVVVMPHINEIISDLDFDLLYLGHWLGENDSINLDYDNFYDDGELIMIKKATMVGGFHGVVIQNTIYDFLLSLPPVNPIDAQLNIYGHHRLKSYIVLPKIIHVKNIMSNCEGCIIQRKEYEIL